jgi:mannitol-1-/sugar-/sorbitol-6-phosphatase
MDGVLVDSTPAVERVWTRWAARHNFDPAQIIAHTHGRTSLASIQELLPIASPETHIAEDQWMERAELEDISDVVALPGAKEILAATPPRQFAVVTSATYELAQVRLAVSGLLPFVRNLVTSTDIQRGKPDPEPYLKGAAKLNIPPTDCIVVEDAVAGVRSGKAAGSRVIALRTTTPDADLLAVGANWLVNDCASIRVTPRNHMLLLELL